MKNRIIYAACCLVGLASLQTTTMADDVDTQTLEEWINPTIYYRDIWDAIKSGDIAYAKKLTGDIIYQELRQTLNDEKRLSVIVEKATEALLAVLNDNSKTDETKADEIAVLIDSMLASYESAPTGQLNLTFKHALEMGVTRLTWDRMIEVDNCSGYSVTTYCDFDSNGVYGCYNSYVWTETYVYKQPDYYIYRIVNGQERLITRLVGLRQVQSNTIFDTSSPWKTAKGVYNLYNHDTGIDESRAFFYDLNADVRNVGDTLAYKVVADNNPQQARKCGTSEVWRSTATADIDGDGKMDYIPDSEYQALFGKYYGWFIPVITMNLN